MQIGKPKPLRWIPAAFACYLGLLSSLIHRCWLILLYFLSGVVDSTPSKRYSFITSSKGTVKIHMRDFLQRSRGGGMWRRKIMHTESDFAYGTTVWGEIILSYASLKRTLLCHFLRQCTQAVWIPRTLEADHPATAMSWLTALLNNGRWSYGPSYLRTVKLRSFVLT